MQERSEIVAAVYSHRDKKEANSALLIVVLLAFALRFVVAAFLIDDVLNPARDHWKFGWETGRLASSLASGHGFSSPLFGQTGPSAWMAPAYPLLLAGVFKLFGIYSTASAWVILTLNCAFGALTCIPLNYIARVSCGPRVAIASAWAWALFPYSIDFSGEMIWSTTLNALLLTTALALTITLERKASAKLWAAWGLFWGFVGLTEPSLLTCLAASGIWLVYRLRQRGLPWAYFWRPALAGVVFCMAVSPWFVRNYCVFHKFVPFREGFGLVLYEGNTADTFEMFPDWANPAHNYAELAAYTRLGEGAYMIKKQQEAIEEITAHPARFGMATLRRIVFTWTGYWDFSPAYRKIEPFALPNVFMTTGLTMLSGSGLIFLFERSFRFALLFAALLVVYPAVYYISQISMSYRHPLDPLLLLLAVSVFCPCKAESAYPAVTSELQQLGTTR